MTEEFLRVWREQWPQAMEAFGGVMGWVTLGTVVITLTVLALAPLVVPFLILAKKIDKRLGL